MCRTTSKPLIHSANRRVYTKCRDKHSAGLQTWRFAKPCTSLWIVLIEVAHDVGRRGTRADNGRAAARGSPGTRTSITTTATFAVLATRWAWWCTCVRMFGCVFLVRSMQFVEPRNLC